MGKKGAKASHHEMKNRRLEATKVATEPKAQKVEASTFQSEEQQFFKKHEQALKKKAGMKDYDSDEDLIRPMIPTSDDHYDNYENEEDSDNEDVDVEQLKKQLAMLERKAKSKKQDASDSEDDEEEKVEASSDDESSDDDDSNVNADNEDGEESSEEEATSSATKKWKKGDFHEEHQKISLKRKSTTDREMQEDEEEEAKELLKKRASRLSKSDALDMDIFGDVLNKKKTSKTSAKSSSKIQKDEIADSEKMRILMKDAPELIDLFNELKSRLQTVRDQINPLLARVKSEKYATQDGLSYLEVKLHLLLSYCTNIIFYMLLKSSGRSVKDHPVIEKLVEMRLLLEKVKPIDERMKSQISKLISLATSQGVSSVTIDHKPKPESMEEEEDSEDEEGEDVDQGARKAKPSLADFEDDDSDEELYSAPKLMPVQYDDENVKRAAKDRKRIERKLRDSEMIKTLKAMGDEPEELPSIGSEIRQSRLLRETEEEEEEMFTRRSLSKRERKKLEEEREKYSSGIDELRNFESFNDLEALDRYAKAKNATNTKATLVQYTGDADSALASLEELNENLDNDDDNDEENYMKASGVLVDIGDDDDDDEEEDDEYQKPKSKQNLKRKRNDNPIREESKPKKSRKLQRDEEDALLDEDQRDSSGKRAATKEIVENKGLMKRAKKENRNSRVKHKNKYKKKAGSIIKQSKIQKGGQDGMVRSVSKSVVRSKRMK